MAEYVALYMPATNNRPDPSRRGFVSEDHAFAFIATQLCRTCKQEREMALRGEKSPDGDEYDQWPACAAEWEVCDVTEFIEAELAKFKYVGVEA
jgi:hypothetical protein